MSTKHLHEIYETIGGINNENKDYKNLSNEQFEWLLKQAQKLNKLHFDLTQTKVMGELENIKIDYVLSSIVSEKY